MKSYKNDLTIRKKSLIYNDSILNKNLIYIFVSLLNGIFYFFISEVGFENIKNLIHFSSMPLVYVICGFSSLCYGTFTYKFLTSISLRPTGFFIFIMAIFTPFAAFPFLAAGIEGLESFKINDVSIILFISFYLFFLRALTFIDGTIKFPVRIQELKLDWKKSFKTKNFRLLLVICISIYTALGYSLSTTDSIFNSILQIGLWLNISSNHTLTNFGYIACIIGLFVAFPMVLYWTQRGLKQILGVSKKDLDYSVNHDQTDKFTYIALVATLPVILGAIGAATGTHAKIFGSLGPISQIIRVSSSILFAVCAGVPGLSTLFRNLYNLKKA